MRNKFKQPQTQADNMNAEGQVTGKLRTKGVKRAAWSEAVSQPLTAQWCPGENVRQSFQIVSVIKRTWNSRVLYNISWYCQWMFLNHWATTVCSLGWTCRLVMACRLLAAWNSRWNYCAYRLRKTMARSGQTFLALLRTNLRVLMTQLIKRKPTSFLSLLSLGYKHTLLSW